MNGKHEILELLKHRLQILNGIRDFYLIKQKYFINSLEKREKKSEQLPTDYLQELSINETKWKQCIKNLKESKNIPSNNPDIIVSLALPEEIVTQYFAYKDRIHQCLQEIDRVKTNLELLISDAFPIPILKLSTAKPRHSNKGIKKPPVFRLSDSDFLGKKRKK